MNLPTIASMRARVADPRHLAILKGMLTVAAFALVGKLLGAAKEMAVAFRYGLAAEVDAYQFLYSLLSWPIGIWCSVLTAVLVPLAARLRASGGDQLPRFRAELLGGGLVLGCLLALLAWIAVPALLASGRGGLPDDVARLVGSALPALILMLPLGVLIGLQSAWMLSAGQHVNTLFDAIPALFIGAAILAFPGTGIAALVWGTVAGSGAHLLALLVPALRGKAIEAPRLRWISPQWRPFWQGFGIMLAGQALMSLTTVIDQFYAVTMGTGANATLGYANRILSLILTLAAIAVSRATLPVFSRCEANDGKLHELVFYWARLMLAAGVVAALACHAAAPAMVALLFQRGEFDADDTAQVAAALRFGLPQLPFYFSSMVLVSYALSQRRFHLIFWCGVIGCLAKVLGNMLLAPMLGVNGIALATSMVYCANAVFLWSASRQVHRPFFHR
ncbi:MAG: murein biosynthesis integral membrane protein MurJ [Janthinobacterium lividum]